MLAFLRNERRELSKVVSRKRPLSSSLPPEEQPTKEQVLALRKAHFANALSISYANTDPLMIVKGEGAWLYDENGVAYLDTRNNVAHCGHSHPTIVQAIQDQVGLINTNTRYLHPNMALLAKKIASKLPEPLNVVYFCNSGTEANDLALRLARVYSGSRNTIVVDGAYHGHSLAVLQVSPYKYEHRNSQGVTEFPLVPPDGDCNFESPGTFIYKVPCPDVYRGKHRNPDTAGTLYAAYVEKACQFYTNRGESVSMIVEGGMSVAGVKLFPPNYLEACARAVRQAGGLLIVDEVQTGFGRLGSSYWAFQHGDATVVPDIVTVGKPFGNGMPLAAVITSRAVADRFDALGIELFNTFGGNPVCTAAGLAMLRVMDDEQLQEQALEVGDYLRKRVNKLSCSIDLIGDVRGSGLFLGIELVRNRDAPEPATQETSFICSTLKSKFKILCSIDGPHKNVIVVKPPMVFSRENADYFVDSFARAALLCADAQLDLSTLMKTPT
ncbi:hypothetical protein MPSEU_000455100 [Mayamaea pseudoterrestris]|nr:hypothetical protein MPSEU_000455100 [Mayamaea pseudoterrestris]